MQHEQGKRYTMEVKTIEHREERGRNWLYTITFIDPKGGLYVAQELVDAQTDTRFLPGMVATFEIRHPSIKPGGFDWITFIANGGAKILHRDNLEISKAAFSCAINLGIMHGWTEETILDKAFCYAIKIKSIAELL